MDAGSTAIYAHNGQGQRVKKDVGGTVTLIAYDEQGRVIGEYDATGNPLMEHVWFDGQPVAALKGTNIYQIGTDHLGTPRVIFEGFLGVVWTWISDPFGATPAQAYTDSTGTLFTYNLRFPGQYFDAETGLHYNYFRTYDPSTGRYLESDPIGLRGGPNTYGYVGGNPLSYIDPFGLIWETDGIDYHGSKNWLMALLDRLATIDEGTVMSANNCFGCTRDVLQEWIPHPDDPQNQRDYCAIDDPYPGQRRKVRQTFTEVYDQWTGRDVGIWEPHVDRQTYEEFPNAVE